MRSHYVLPLFIISLAACSQNPHLPVQDPPKKTASDAVRTTPVGDKDKDGVNDDVDQCVDVPGPAENKGCPYSTHEDTDQDGLRNEVDKCPTQPGPKSNNGCPYDSFDDTDQDGVPNTEDECPTKQGPAENHGCPYDGVNDTDRDGVPDTSDRCPRQPGPIANDGCPVEDRDGDGVVDPIDDCPDEAGPATNKGCPLGERDTDGDYVPDNRDKCPLVPGQIFNDGCPMQDRDTDRDGTPDRRDACIWDAGPADNFGCPWPKEEERRILLEVAASLKFYVDEARIKESSYPALERLAGFLRRHPGARLKMVGHTSLEGTDEHNLRLSWARVEAIRDYLAQHGVLPSRTVIDARGERQPLVSEEGLAGAELERARAKNRRVDMLVTYTSYRRERVR